MRVIQRPPMPRSKKGGRWKLAKEDEQEKQEKATQQKRTEGGPSSNAEKTLTSDGAVLEKMKGIVQVHCPKSCHSKSLCIYTISQGSINYCQAICEKTS